MVIYSVGLHACYSSNEADYEDESLTWDDLGAATTGQILPGTEF